MDHGEVKKGFDIYCSLVERLVNRAGIVGAFLLLVVSGITLYEVIMRYIFEAPTTWSINISIYLVMWGTFLGAAYTLRLGGHINIDILLKKFPVKMAITIKIFNYILVLLFCLVLTWRGLVSCIDAYIYKEITLSYTRTPLYLPMLSIPFGGGLLILEILRELLEMVQSRKK